MSADSLIDLCDSNEIDEGTLKKYLDRIISQINRASDIINHMRVFGRVASKDMIPVSLVRSAANAATFLKEQFKLLSIDIVFDEPESCRLVHGNDLHLEQVILNLLNNARDAIEKDRENNPDKERSDKITLNVIDDPDSGHVQLLIGDTGCGIDENVIDHIFEPFFTTKEVNKGTGLGLSITYGMITDMNGTISASNEKEGTVFTISLPVADEAAIQSHDGNPS